jgi:hypothetical protein
LIKSDRRGGYVQGIDCLSGTRQGIDQGIDTRESPALTGELDQGVDGPTAVGINQRSDQSKGFLEGVIVARHQGSEKAYRRRRQAFTEGKATVGATVPAIASSSTAQRHDESSPRSRSDQHQESSGNSVEKLSSRRTKESNLPRP